MEKTLHSLAEYLCCISHPQHCNSASNEKSPLLAHEQAAFKTKTTVTAPYCQTPALADLSQVTASRAIRGEETASRIFHAIVQWNGPRSSSSNEQLKRTIKHEVDAYGGWNEWLAERLVNRFVELVKSRNFDSANETLKKAWDERHGTRRRKNASRSSTGPKNTRC